MAVKPYLIFKITTALAVAWVLAAPARAEPSDALPALQNGTISARYSVHWGLLRLADLTLTWRLGADRFETRMAARTRGITRALFKIDSVLTSAGTRNEGQLNAQSFTTDNLVNGDIFAREIAFDETSKAAVTRTVRPDDYELVRSSIPDDLKYGPDPLTAFLATLLQPSSVSARRSFDGVQVLENTLLCDGALDTLKKKRRTAFHGAAQRCSLTGEVLAGEVIDDEGTPEDEDVDGRDFETLIWFARTADDAMRLPVRIRAQSKRGTLKIYLRAAGQDLES